MFGPQREKTCNRCSFRPDFFLLVPHIVIVRNVEKKSFLNYFFILSADSKYYLFR